MLEIQNARENLSNLLVDLKEVEEFVVRGEKRLGSQTYAVAYVDLADNVVERSNSLREFQERILGDDFFDSKGDLRWNKYLYIVAGPNSIADAAAYATAKEAIEADKDYARKRVVTEDELTTLLGGATLFESVSADQVSNVVSDWEQHLSSHELDLLLDCQTPRTSVVERVANGNAKREISQERTRPLNSADIHLSTSRIAELTIENFRQIHNGKTYKFGQVTLLIGPNGSGKTSLLEAIEYFYCGNNRRDSSTSSLSVMAKLTKPVTGEEFQLISTSETPRIKARCLAWYNRDERNSKAIVDGFTRYNFLDTDAAFRISTDLEPSEVATDLSRLLVGPSAAKIWDYLTKVHTDIDRALDRAQGIVDREVLVLEANEKTLKSMQDKPSIVKALAETYRQTLGNLGWLQAPKDLKVEASEGDLLLNTIGHLQALQAAGPAARTIGAIQARHHDLNEAISQATPHATQLAELHSKQKILTSEIKTHEVTIGNIDRWIVYVSSEFPKLRALAPQASNDAQIASVRLGKFAVGQLPEIPSAYQVVSLEVAKHIIGETLIQAENKVRELQAIADKHGRAAANRATLATRLKDAVLAALAQTDNTDICPVCRTAHPSGELSHLIAALTEETAENPELQQITESLQSAKLQLQTASTNLNTIQFIGAVAHELGLGTDSLVPDVIRQLLDLRAQATELTEIAHSTSNKLHELENSGLSQYEYDLIFDQINSIFAGMEETIDTATTVRYELLNQIKCKQNEFSEIQSKIMNAGVAIRNICQQVVTPEWSTSVAIKDTVDTLIALRDELKLVLDHVPQVQSYITISGDTPLSEVQAQVMSASVAFKEAFSAAHSEAANSQELTKLSTAVSDGKLAIHKAKEEAKALRIAVAVLGSLLVDSSLEKATKDSLDAIGNQINEVFSRIHAPREYKYVGENNVLLKAIANNEIRNLEQISTGQRAAFALSIFLALNITAKSAPPVLLIDDPIAHIDDLNALSFLDYLRDLAVNSGRQVFFATADTRIASLFSKKFSFLGDEFKTIQLTRSLIP